MDSEAFGDAYPQLFTNIMLGAVIFEPIEVGALLSADNLIRQVQ